MKSLALIFAVLFLAASSPTPAAPSLASDRDLTLSFNAIPVRAVIELLADFTQTNMIVTDCPIDRTVDLRLSNTPASVVLDVLAARAGLTYTEQPGVILVSCRESAAPDPRLQVRVSLGVEELPLDGVLAFIANAAGLVWAGCSDCREPITLTLPQVRVQTTLGVLSDITGRVFSVESGVLRVQTQQ